MTNDDKYHQGLESIVIGNMYCSVYFFTTLFGTGDIQHIFDQNMIDSMQVLTTLICQMSAAAAKILSTATDTIAQTYAIFMINDNE